MKIVYILAFSAIFLAYIFYDPLSEGHNYTKLKQNTGNADTAKMGAEQLNSIKNNNVITYSAYSQQQPDKSRVATEEPLTQRIIEIARPAENMPDEIQHNQELLQGEYGRLSYLDVREMIKNHTNNNDQINIYNDIMFDINVSYDVKQEVLANSDNIFKDDADQIDFLEKIINETNQPVDLRVLALNKLSDFGMEYVNPYVNNENREIKSEVDLLKRIDAYKAQQNKYASIDTVP